MFQKARGDVATAPDASESPTSKGSHPSTKERLTGPSRIGAATLVRGEVSGEEDLFIEGQVIGDITIPTHLIKVGAGGSVEGQVIGAEITIEGRIEGKLIASQRITLKAGAVVYGDLHSPNLMLEEGAIFHGTIDMDPDQKTLSDSFASDVPENIPFNVDKSSLPTSREGDSEDSA
ncbi:bactofilin family protein [Salinicola aestuarinus]|uniref:bactofilin family protein n=1 Tax=Salinicola aestuarinus TaxID=1949082 RepID=UPI000DA121D7|nr:polymer-forming cytoskeletal protein [Salinicola aestuarinus]